MNKNDAYAQQIEMLQQQITEENDRTENIEEFRSYTKTDPYIEKVAREKLGLVYPDEIPLFEKYDEYVPAELVRKGFANGILAVGEMKARIADWMGDIAPEG